MASLFDLLSKASGLVLLLFILVIVTSYIIELIANFYKLRANNLANAIQNLLEPSTDYLHGVSRLRTDWKDGKELWDKSAASAAGQQFNIYIAGKLNESLLKAFYSHPIIASLSKPRGLPDYISPTDFSLALLNLFSKAGSETIKGPEEYLEAIKIGIYLLDDNSLKMGLLSFFENADIFETEATKRIDIARSYIEGWFNSAMNATSGWYKRWINLVSIIIGIMIALVLNVDSITITQGLWREQTLRQSLSDAAIAYIQKGDAQKADAYFTELSSNMDFPIGWSFKLADANALSPIIPHDIPSTMPEIFWKCAGLTITGLAISIGSGIWFEFMQRYVNIRSSGPKPPD